MKLTEQLRNLAQKFATGGTSIDDGPGFGKKVTKQYKDDTDREIVEFEDGTRIYTDSDEYKTLYSQGLLYMENPEKTTFPQANGNSELDRFKRIESENPYSEFIQPYFEGTSGVMARGLGQSKDNLANTPEEWKKSYDTRLNKLWAQEFFKENSRLEGEDRGTYLDRVGSGLKPDILKNLYDYMPEREMETYWQLGEKGVAALTDLKGMPGLENFANLEDYIQGSNHMSDYEKSNFLADLKENPNSTRLGTAVGTLAPLGILAETVVAGGRDDYSVEDAGRGIQNNTPWQTKLAVDPFNLVGMGLFSKLGSASKFSEGLSAINKFGKEASVISDLKKIDKEIDIASTIGRAEKTIDVLPPPPKLDANSPGLIGTHTPRNRVMEMFSDSKQASNGVLTDDAINKLGMEYNAGNFSSEETMLFQRYVEHVQRTNTRTPFDLTNAKDHIANFRRNNLPNRIAEIINDASVSPKGFMNPDESLRIGMRMQSGKYTPAEKATYERYLDHRSNTNNLYPYEPPFNPSPNVEPYGTARIAGGRNKSGFTKSQLRGKNEKTDEVINNLTDEEFANTVLKPSGEIKPFNNTFEKPNVEHMSKEAWVDAFNSGLDELNAMIKANNKSGKDFSVMPMDATTSRLTFSSMSDNGSPVESIWGVKTTPGKFTGEIQDVSNVDYMNSIPGLGISNSSNGIFGAGFNPRRGTGVYKSLNDYLKKADLGRIKSGMNSQTNYSRPLWESAVKSGKAVGYVGDNSNTVYGIMKTLIPGAIGIGAASSLTEEEELQNLTQKYQVGGTIGLLKDQLQNLAQKYQVGGEIKSDQYRPDGTLKGKGFIGTFKSKDGKDMTEFSIGLEIDGKEMNVPTMVPELTEEEINYLTQGGDMSAKSIGNPIADSIAKKASDHARERLKNGKSVYAQPDEYQVGGQTPTAVEDWKQKYSTNPYFKDREDWGEKLDTKFPNAKNTVRESVYAAARHSGIDPGLLYTSSMEEGMKLALTGQDNFERRSGYNEYRKNNPKGAQEFPVDGGYFYGLNTFGDKYGVTIKPSSLPQGFKYAPYDQKGEDGSKVYTSAAFKTHGDAILAKAAMMKQVESAMTARLSKNKLDLSPDARKFFDMVGYNMGEDKTIDMIKSYQQKGYLKDDRFLDPKFQPASWKEPYTNVQRRYQNYRILNEQKYFDDYESLDSKSNVAVNQNLQLGGTTDTLDGTKEWWDRYVNSPKYKERLQKEFPKYSESEIDSELAARKLNLDRTYPIVGSGDFDDPGIQGYAHPPERDQRQSSSWKGKIRNFIEDSVAPSSRPVHIRNGSDTGVYAHEISHSVDEGGRRIPDKTIGNILQRVRGVEPIKISNNDGETIYYDRVQNEDTIKALQNTDNFYQLDNGIDEEQAAIYPNIKWKIGGDKTEYSPKFGYRSNPTEILARLQSLRKDMYRKGAHDSANEDINTEQLQNYLDQVFQGDDEINTDLLDLLNEVKSNVNSDKDEIVENLKWMLNNIAKNDYPEKQQVKRAQKGGMIRSELDSLSTKYKSRPSTTR